jgi:hypothetical protein
MILVDQIVRQQEEIERLRQVCRDAYEIYAGSEGIPMPETAAEAYLYQLLNQMKDEIAKGLGGCNNNCNQGRDCKCT